MICWSISPNFSFSASALKDVLNSSLNNSKVSNNSGVKGDFLSFEKNVSIIPSCPFIPPRSKASKKSITFSSVSDSVFPNIASSLWRTQISYHVEWYFCFCYAII